MQSYIILSFRCNYTGREEGFNQRALCILPHMELLKRQSLFQTQHFITAARDSQVFIYFNCCDTSVSMNSENNILILAFRTCSQSPYCVYFSVRSPPTHTRAAAARPPTQTNTHFSLCLHCIIRMTLQNGLHHACMGHRAYVTVCTSYVMINDVFAAEQIQ